MGLFRNLFLNREVKGAIGILDEFAVRFRGSGFERVRDQVEAGFRKHPHDLASIVNGGTPLRQIVMQALANTAGDHIVSGHYHPHRGVLDPSGPGNEILRLFDAAVDELVQMNAIDPDFAATRKGELRERIGDVG